VATSERNAPAGRVLCLVPAEIGEESVATLEERLDGRARLIREQRSGDRRRAQRRQRAPKLDAAAEERRSVNNPEGRRIDDRRAAVVPLKSPPARAPRGELAGVTFVRADPADERRLEVAESLRLVVRFQLKDPTAFRAIYERHFDAVYRYLLTALRDVHEAEDAAQEAFVRALSALPRYEFRGIPFEAWLFRIVRNCALNVRRRARPVSPADPEELERWRERRDERAAMNAAVPWESDAELLYLVERLPVPQRQVIVLRYMVGLEWADIADILDRSSGAVRQLEQRALRFLRTRLEPIREGSVSDRTKPVAMSRMPSSYPVTSGRQRALAVA
jgi:RNA polymerase sigma-70 factor, ECF subfamily